MALTFGLANQFEGLNVERRRSRSPLSHGLHEGCEEPRAEPPAFVLKEVRRGWEPIQDKGPALEPCALPCQSMLATLVGAAAEDAPAELRHKKYHT